MLLDVPKKRTQYNQVEPSLRRISQYGHETQTNVRYLCEVFGVNECDYSCNEGERVRMREGEREREWECEYNYGQEGRGGNTFQV